METEQELTYTAGLPESHVEMGHHKVYLCQKLLTDVLSFSLCLIRSRCVCVGKQLR